MIIWQLCARLVKLIEVLSDELHLHGIWFRYTWFSLLLFICGLLRGSPLNPITRIFPFFKWLNLALLHCFCTVFLICCVIESLICDQLFLLWDTGGWSGGKAVTSRSDPLWLKSWDLLKSLSLSLFLTSSGTNAQGCPLSNDVLSPGCGFAWQDSGASLFRRFENRSSMFAIVYMYHLTAVLIDRRLFIFLSFNICDSIYLFKYLSKKLF